MLTLNGDAKRAQLVALKEHPVEWFTSWTNMARLAVYANTTLKEDVLFFLQELTTTNADPIIRRNAQMLIEQYVPTI